MNKPNRINKAIIRNWNCNSQKIKFFKKKIENKLSVYLKAGVIGKKPMFGDY